MRRSFLATIAVASVAAFVLVACGSDEGSIDTLPLMTAAPTLAPSTEMVTTTVPAAEEFYTIQQGDTLFGIAQSFGVSVDELISFNAIADPDAIQAGQRLRIPPASATTTTAASTTVAPTTP
ncbi:MAG: LysM peptidoglycan-binding domain-containing protein [Ilumatobacteraceae bacterium]